jgi:hypothetical protein
VFRVGQADDRRLVDNGSLGGVFWNRSVQS